MLDISSILIRDVRHRGSRRRDGAPSLDIKLGSSLEFSKSEH